MCITSLFLEMISLHLFQCFGTVPSYCLHYRRFSYIGYVGQFVCIANKSWIMYTDWNAGNSYGVLTARQKSKEKPIVSSSWTFSKLVTMMFSPETMTKPRVLVMMKAFCRLQLLIFFFNDNVCMKYDILPAARWNISHYF